MKKFLEKVVDHLAGSGLDLGRVAVVFPSRRAGLFFEHYLQANTEIRKPLIAPEVFSIGEFVERLSGRAVHDDLSLLFRLFKIHRREYGDEPFEDFCTWGKGLLSDFKEIDEHLVDAQKLFRDLETLAGMEGGAATDRPGSGSVRAEFLRYAAKAGWLHAALADELEKSGAAYYGLALRAAAGALEKDPSITAGWEKIAFIGFNALTAGEKKLMKTLHAQGRAEFFWDVDRYFTRDDNQEAGRFFRENRRAGLVEEEFHWEEDLLGRGAKLVNIVGAAGNVAQSKACALLLERLAAESRTSGQSEHETAIVLPDESLLFPLLHSLPPSVARVNVTMGFPLKLTPVFTLVAALIEMRESRRRLGREDDFYFPDVERILFHPYVQAAAGEEAVSLARELSARNTAFIAASELSAAAGPVLKRVFEPAFSGIRAFCTNLLEVLREIRLALLGGAPGTGGEATEIEIEYFYALFRIVQRLQDLVEASGIEMELSTFWRLLRAEIDSARVPFYGEPLKGFQVMGLLETRALDFKNVIILSANEGILPESKTGHGFIPQEVRLRHNLPGYDSHDAMFAYNFYRLLGRADNIHIFYNTEHDEHGAKAGRSRFLEQLLFEFADRNKNARVENRIAVFSAKSVQCEPIVVPKSEATLDGMLARGYSPTAIGTFLRCPLQFYFKEVLGLAEPEAVREHADAGMFGNAVHEALAELYKAYLGKPVGKKELAAMTRRAPEIAEQAYKRVLKFRQADQLRGRNFLNVRIVQELLARFLDKEGRQPPCEILDVECDKYRSSVQFSTGGATREAVLRGRIDRIDRCGDVLRVIDYKTGSAHSLLLDWARRPGSVEERPDFVGALGKKAEAVQLLVYFCLLADTPLFKATPGGVRLGTYWFASDKYAFLHPERSKTDDVRLAAGDVPIVRGLVQTIFEEMFDKDRPFVQCEDDTACRYCAYKDICCR